MCTKRLKFMFDTSPEITKKMREMFQEKTPFERAKMGSSMFDTSKQLVVRFILEHHPGISKVGLRQQIFLKFYGDDFSSKEKEKILQHIEQQTEN